MCRVIGVNYCSIPLWKVMHEGFPSQMRNNQIPGHPQIMGSNVQRPAGKIAKGLIAARMERLQCTVEQYRQHPASHPVRLDILQFTAQIQRCAATKEALGVVQRMKERFAQTQLLGSGE